MMFGNSFSGLGSVLAAEATHIQHAPGLRRAADPLCCAKQWRAFIKSRGARHVKLSGARPDTLIRGSKRIWPRAADSIIFGAIPQRLMYASSPIRAQASLRSRSTMSSGVQRKIGLFTVIWAVHAKHLSRVRRGWQQGRRMK